MEKRFLQIFLPVAVFFFLMTNQVLFAMDFRIGLKSTFQRLANNYSDDIAILSTENEIFGQEFTFSMNSGRWSMVLGLPYNYNRNSYQAISQDQLISLQNSASTNGFSDSYLGYSYQFLNENYFLPGIAVLGTVTSPTGDYEKGLGLNLWQKELALFMNKWFSQFQIFLEGGMKIPFCTKYGSWLWDENNHAASFFFMTGGAGIKLGQAVYLAMDILWNDKSFYIPENSLYLGAGLALSFIPGMEFALHFQKELINSLQDYNLGFSMDFYIR